MRKAKLLKIDSDVIKIQYEDTKEIEEFKGIIITKDVKFNNDIHIVEANLFVNEIQSKLNTPYNKQLKKKVLLEMKPLHFSRGKLHMGSIIYNLTICKNEEEREKILAKVEEHGTPTQKAFLKYLDSQREE